MGKVVTLSIWCESQEGFEGKSPLYVLELYPYTLQPHPELRRGAAPWATGALDKYFPYREVVLLYVTLYEKPAAGAVFGARAIFGLYFPQTTSIRIL